MYIYIIYAVNQVKAHLFNEVKPIKNEDKWLRIVKTIYVKKGNGFRLYVTTSHPQQQKSIWVMV